MPVLLIGGYSAGEIITLQSGGRTVDLPVLDPVQSLMILSREEEAPSVIQRDRYHTTGLEIGDVGLFAEIGFTPEEAKAELLAGYRLAAQLVTSAPHSHRLLNQWSDYLLSREVGPVVLRETWQHLERERRK